MNLHDMLLARATAAGGGGTQDNVVFPETACNGSMKIDCQALVAGKVYDVHIEGNVYTLTAIATTYGGDDVTTLGNLGILGGSDTGEPFLILQGDGDCYVIRTETTETTVAIYEFEIPYFDLAAMGLPIIPADMSTVSVEADYSAIVAALGKGPVKFRVSANMGVDITVDFVATGTTVVGSGTGIVAMMHSVGMVIAFCVGFSNGEISAYGRVLTTG